MLDKLYSAMEKSLAFAIDPANKADVLSNLEQQAGADAPIAEWGYDNLVTSGYFYTGGKPDAGGLDGIVASLKSLGFLTDGQVPTDAQIWDSSLVPQGQ